MGHITSTTSALALFAVGALTLPISAVAQGHGQFGGMPVEMGGGSKGPAASSQTYVDVRSDPSYGGPRNLTEAIRLAKTGGTITVHPGEYLDDSIELRKSVTIRGVAQNGRFPRIEVRAPTRSCINQSESHVTASISNITFVGGEGTSCINVSAGNFTLENSQVLGRSMSINRTTRPVMRHTNGESFNLNEATSIYAPLVNIRGGRVQLVGNQIMGGETGVYVSRQTSGYGYEHVQMRENEVSYHEKAGVILAGGSQSELTGNTIANNAMGGIIYTGTGEARLVGNNINDNGNDGLYVGRDGQHVTLENNIIYDNVSDGIEVHGGTSILVGNRIGENGDGCSVRRIVEDHLNTAQIFTDYSGQTAYKASSSCASSTRQASNRSANTGQRRRFLGIF